MIGADAIGRLAIAQEPSASSLIILNAATGTFNLTGEAATFNVTMQAAQGAYALSGQAAGVDFILLAATGFFRLTGFDISPSFTTVQQPMKIVQDQWDVDEWGRFYRGGAMRYTL